MGALQNLVPMFEHSFCQLDFKIASLFKTSRAKTNIF